MHCGIELDDIAWDHVLAYNGVSGRFIESALDNEYCMRCGSHQDECECEISITEEVFDEFMKQWGDQEERIYAPAPNMVAQTCWDCEHMATPQCPRLLDFIHAALKDFRDDLESFDKITKCDYFTLVPISFLQERVP